MRGGSSGELRERLASLAVGGVAGAAGCFVGGLTGSAVLLVPLLLLCFAFSYYTSGRKLSGRKLSASSALGVPLLVDGGDAELASANEQLVSLRQRCFAAEREAAEARAASLPPVNPAGRRQLSRSPAVSRRVEHMKLGPRSETTEVAERVAAAAEAVSSSSELHVTTDNDADESSTVVRVTAPNREGLLADLTAALSGLGLSIVKAQISTIADRALNTFYVSSAWHRRGLV